jgi:hypothetical protein
MFAVTYGSNVDVFDQFESSLSNKGETIAVLRPTHQGDVLVDKVNYESVKPWPQTRQMAAHHCN